MSTEATLEKQADRTERTRAGRYFRPNVDILENADELVVLADMPGVKADAIDINFEDGELTIHGKVESRYPERADFLLYEYDIGDYYRTFRVSEQIDSTAIRAEHHDGVLTLHLPKVAAAKPRRIKVESQ